MTTKPAEELDGRIAAAFSEDAKSGDVARPLAEVKTVTFAAEAAAETARKHALDPLLSGDDLKLARREMLDAAFKRDRLQEASAKLTERAEALKALEADRRMGDEHERVEDEWDRLAEETERMADPIAQIAHLVRQIEACDREIGLNATSTAKFGHSLLGQGGIGPFAVAGVQLSPNGVFRHALRPRSRRRPDNASPTHLTIGNRANRRLLRWHR